jgi:membrane-associated phospholipid phosphatase
MSLPAPHAARVSLARAVSVLLHPFAVFMALALLAAWRLDPASVPRTAAGIVVAVAIVWAFVLQRRRSGRWQTVDASRPQERPALYLLVLAVAGGYWWWLGGSGSPASIGVLAAIAMLCAAGLANRWIKLSLHMASLAFAGVALLGLVPMAGLIALALLPLLGWSRLRMGRHALSEVLGGALLGLACAAALLVKQ